MNSFALQNLHVSIHGDFLISVNLHVLKHGDSKISMFQNMAIKFRLKKIKIPILTFL